MAGGLMMMEGVVWELGGIQSFGGEGKVGRGEAQLCWEEESGGLEQGRHTHEKGKGGERGGVEPSVQISKSLGGGGGLLPNSYCPPA